MNGRSVFAPTVSDREPIVPQSVEKVPDREDLDAVVGLQGTRFQADDDAPLNFRMIMGERPESLQMPGPIRAAPLASTAIRMSPTMKSTSVPPARRQ